MKQATVTATSSRRADLDTVGGICIVYMIIGHVCGTDMREHIEWLTRVFFFFMAWFFFKAGMFHRPDKTLKQIVMGGG